MLLISIMMKNGNGLNDDEPDVATPRRNSYGHLQKTMATLQRQYQHQ